jgi:MHS family proline/betaine transporter-like MFS transporter
MNYTQPVERRDRATAFTEPVGRAISASALGNATEWFDYGIYAYGLTFCIGGALVHGADSDIRMLPFWYKSMPNGRR